MRSLCDGSGRIFFPYIHCIGLEGSFRQVYLVCFVGDRWDGA